MKYLLYPFIISLINDNQTQQWIFVKFAMWLSNNKFYQGQVPSAHIVLLPLNNILIFNQT